MDSILSTSHFIWLITARVVAIVNLRASQFVVVKSMDGFINLKFEFPFSYKCIEIRTLDGEHCRPEQYPMTGD